jgi:hypothetical protein
MSSDEKKEDELIHTMQVIAANVDNKSGIGEPKTGYLEYANYLPLTLFSIFLDTDKLENLKTPLSTVYKLSLILGLAVVYIICGSLSFVAYYYGSQNYTYILTSIAWWFLMFFVIIMLFPVKPIFEIKTNRYLSRISGR